MNKITFAISFYISKYEKQRDSFAKKQWILFLSVFVGMEVNCIYKI